MTVVEAARHPARTEWFWTELGVLRATCALAEHPYFLALAEGRFSRADLGVWAAEQERLAVAGAEGLRRAASRADGLMGEQLTELAADAAMDIDRWRRLMVAAAGSYAHASSYDAGSITATAAATRHLAGSPAVDLLDLAVRVLFARTLASDAGADQVRALERYGFDEHGTGWLAHGQGDGRWSAVGEGVIDRAAGQHGAFAVLARFHKTADVLWAFYDELDARRVETTVRRRTTMRKDAAA
ncbi:MAG TPA: hypothetical protein VNT03_10135 [Baekduia sp.]|nr:hypothetical protein [Baekduia sp.]